MIIRIKFDSFDSVSIYFVLSIFNLEIKKSHDEIIGLRFKESKKEFRLERQ